MADTQNVYQKLLAVQSSLVAPRQAGGRFGKARSAEQVLEALKPHLKANGLVLVTTETITQRNDRFYMTCTATVTNVDKPDESITAVAEAREGEEERGLDPSQVTGKASSYAKKYALQHLFSIDDTKDADHTDAPDDSQPAQHQEQPAGDMKPRASSNRIPSDKQLGMIRALSRELGIDEAVSEKRIELLETSAQASEAIEKLQAAKAKKEVE